MAILYSLIKKEAYHILRDKRTMIITLMMPLVLLLLFGFAISTEVNDVRIVAIVDCHTDETRNIVERLRVNPYITFKGMSTNSDVDDILRTGNADAVVFIKDNEGKPACQIIVDASNPVIAQASTGYVQSIIMGDSNISPALTYTLYNPQLKSAYNFVPGIMGMIFILICAIMTSVSLVREKENGTMDLLLISPVKPRTIIMGKLIPYFLLSCVILFVMLTIGYTVLGLPMSSSIFDIIIISLLYILLSLSIGLLVSAVVSTQLNALIVSAVAFMLPVIMLSGMIFPIDNMPAILQWLSGIIPARWYIQAMRKLMIQQLNIEYVLQEIIILSSMTAAILMIALKKFNSR